MTLRPDIGFAGGQHLVEQLDEALVHHFGKRFANRFPQQGTVADHPHIGGIG
jgi:hypothetical protein